MCYKMLTDNDNADVTGTQPAKLWVAEPGETTNLLEALTGVFGKPTEIFPGAVAFGEDLDPGADGTDGYRDDDYLPEGQTPVDAETTARMQNEMREVIAKGFDTQSVAMIVVTEDGHAQYLGNMDFQDAMRNVIEAAMVSRGYDK